MSEQKKRRWGDRRDGEKVRDLTGLGTIMLHMLPNRTEAEVYLHETIDVTELMKFIEKKNAEHPEYKTSLFHCIITACARMLRERPAMNRFVAGHTLYQRNHMSLGFVARRRFKDDSEESLMFLNTKDEETIDDITRRIVGDVKEIRKSEHSEGGIDSVIDSFAKIPRLLLMLVIRIIRWLDFWDLVPRALQEGDPNFASVFLTNLGSIKCPAVYHHLNNYGTNSMMIAVGCIHKEEIVLEDGTKAIRDVVDIGATLDERIGDGFYFARSLKLIRHICAHPDILDLPLGTPCGYDYK